MSYQVLARRWRPRQFADVVGQSHVVKALSHALTEQRLHHAYLFTGTRGVGKTTLARILAKSVNCLEGMSAQPCGQCAACESINQGRFVDLIEVDAASRTKVEDTRELLDNVHYAPTQGRYKVYLIDEVHMLSTHSFNALLKTLEEPPEHVIFLLATTDPQKLPVTVLSRCLQFHLKAMRPQEISQHLQHIAQQEGLNAEPQALALVAQAAQGSMRDALSLLDQAIAYGQGQVVALDVQQMLGVLPLAEAQQLLGQLMADDIAAALEHVEQLDAYAPDYAQILADMLQLLHQLALMQHAPEAVICSDSVQHWLQQGAKALSIESVQAWYQIALQSRQDLGLAPEARMGFEMALLRMAHLRIAGDVPLDASATPTVNSAPVSAPQVAVEPPASAKPKPAARMTAAEQATPSTPASSVATPESQSPVEVTLALNKTSAITTPLAAESQPAEPPGRLDATNITAVPTATAHLSQVAEPPPAYEPHAPLPSEAPPPPEMAPPESLDYDLPEVSQAATLAVPAPAPAATPGIPGATADRIAQLLNRAKQKQQAVAQTTAPSSAVAPKPEPKTQTVPPPATAVAPVPPSEPEEPTPALTPEPLQPSTDVALDVSTIVEDWARWVAAMPNGFVRQICENSSVRQCQGTQITLALGPQAAALLSAQPARKNALTEMLRQLAQQPVQLETEQGLGDQQTPAQQRAAAQAAHRQAVIAATAQDPGVQAIMQHFDLPFDPEAVEVLSPATINP